LANQEKSVTIRFYEELNDFLPDHKRKIHYILPFFGSPSIKDVIESQGVPHTEVDLILVSGISVNFQYNIAPGDRISVYPEFEILDISPLIQLRPKPLRITRFIADAHMGKLARYLRMCGFDTVFKNDISDNEIINRSIKEKRIILTRDLGILKNGQVQRGYFVRTQKPIYQCREVFQKFDLFRQNKPFTRCMECNGLFYKANKKSVRTMVPLKTYKYYQDFYRCNDCQNIYWKGSHYEKMLKTIDKICSPGADQ
jgi:uncharacterized protein with PIN domain